MEDLDKLYLTKWLMKKFGKDLGKKGFKADIEKDLLKEFEDALEDETVLSKGSGRSSERRKERGQRGRRGAGQRRPQVNARPSRGPDGSE